MRVLPKFDSVVITLLIAEFSVSIGFTDIAESRGGDERGKHADGNETTRLKSVAACAT